MKIDIYKNYGPTNFITGLRFYAAIAILVVHSGSMNISRFDFGSRISELLSGGVYVFFVISGFSIASSFTLSRNYWEYLIKRFSRVLPLYYFWLALSILLGATAVFWQDYFHREVDLENVFSHFFLISFLDYRIANSILGVEWSIPIELCFYVLIPIILVLTKRKEIAIFSILASILFYCFCYENPSVFFPNAAEPGLALHWSPLNYVLSFVLGVSSYRFRELPNQFYKIRNSLLAIITFFVFAFFFRDESILIQSYFLLTFGTFYVLIFYVESGSKWSGFLTNRIILFGGSISYGIYLSHFPLMRLLSEYFGLKNGSLELLLSTFLLSCFISTLTRILIEIPTGKLISRLF